MKWGQSQRQLQALVGLCRHGELRLYGGHGRKAESWQEENVKDLDASVGMGCWPKTPALFEPQATIRVQPFSVRMYTQYPDRSLQL